MGYIKENKAIIENLFSNNIENDSIINTVYLQTGSTNVTENLTSNALTTKSFKQSSITPTIGSNVQLTRDILLNNGNIIYNITGNVTVTLPSMTSQDVGLVVRIGKGSESGSQSLTIRVSSSNFLNNTANGSTVILGGTITFRDIILYKVSGGLSYWITQLA